MSNKIILWVQSPKADNKSLLSYNGKRYSVKDKEYQTYFSQVSIHDKYSKIGEIGDTVVFHGRLEDGNSYIIYSNFNEEDEIGRKIGYMARIDLTNSKSDVEDIKAVLDKEADLYGYTISSQPFDIIRALLKKKKVTKIIISIIVFLIVLIELLSNI